MLFINVPNLEPDISMDEGAGRVVKDTIKASQRLFVFSLLLIDDTKAEKDFIGLVKVLIVVSMTWQKMKRQILLLSMRRTEEKASSA